MSIFLSKYINNLDKKYRVTVPAGYRAILVNETFNGIIAYSSFRNQSIEVCGISRLERICELIQTLDPYSAERDAFETIILGEAVQLPFDTEGRVVLPKTLIEHAGIVDEVCFVGKGLMFEIWNPDSFASYLSTAKQIAQNNRLTLKNI